MEIKTFTSFWNIEKKVYSIYDIQLPFAVSIRSIGVFAVTGVPYWIILNIFGMPFGLQTIIVWLAIPLALSVIGNKPIFEGKNIVDYLSSRIKFLFESKKYKGLKPATEKPKSKTRISEYFYTINR